MLFLGYTTPGCKSSDTVICHHISGEWCPAKYCIYFTQFIIVISWEVCCYLANTEECWTAVQKNRFLSAQNIFPKLSNCNHWPLFWSLCLFHGHQQSLIYKMIWIWSVWNHIWYIRLLYSKGLQHSSKWHMLKQACQQNLRKLGWAQISPVNCFSSTPSLILGHMYSRIFFSHIKPVLMTSGKCSDSGKNKQ